MYNKFSIIKDNFYLYYVLAYFYLFIYLGNFKILNVLFRTIFTNYFLQRFLFLSDILRKAIKLESYLIKFWYVAGCWPSFLTDLNLNSWKKNTIFNPVSICLCILIKSPKYEAGLLETQIKGKHCFIQTSLAQQHLLWIWFQFMVKLNHTCIQI